LIFIDTGPFLARHLLNDQYHQDALVTWEKLKREGEKCFTSNFVLDETFSLLGRRANYAFAVQRAKIIYSSQTLTIMRPGMEDEMNALQFFGKYAAQQVSFTDCISMVLMKSKDINRVFSYDRHFELAGFQVVR